MFLNLPFIIPPERGKTTVCFIHICNQSENVRCEVLNKPNNKHFLANLGYKELGKKRKIREKKIKGSHKVQNYPKNHFIKKLKTFGYIAFLATSSFSNRRTLSALTLSKI